MEEKDIKFDRILDVTVTEHSDEGVFDYVYRQFQDINVTYDEETGRLEIVANNCVESLVDQRVECVDVKDPHIEIPPHDCLTLCFPNPTEFEVAITRALKDGYEMQASSCNSKEWKAILVR